MLELLLVVRGEGERWMKRERERERERGFVIPKLGW